MQLDHDLNIYEISVPKAWCNKSIAELDIRKKHNLNVIAMRIRDQLVLPRPDMLLNADDAMLILGSIKDIQKAF